MPRHVRIRVLGRDLVVERPWGSAPRVLADGTELPRDRFGRYRLAGPDGERVVATEFDWRRLTPVLVVGDDRVALDAPLARGAWLLLAPVALLSLAGGGIGAGLGIGAVWFAATRLRVAEGAPGAAAPAAGAAAHAAGAVTTAGRRSLRRAWAEAVGAVLVAALLYVAVVASGRALL
ncbi:hypothetical protein [Cellulomonas sp.]|uniref:hypothetical protein n=1 Tax=Cellulomonas sp. TaxID=40001 RepID=UPI002D463016|nr:hypothetical protein [Cellulomonas sp.]HYQ77034.1 hypothetical protein [Cellulomonas sp.]